MGIVTQRPDKTESNICVITHDKTEFNVYVIKHDKTESNVYVIMYGNINTTAEKPA